MGTIKRVTVLAAALLIFVYTAHAVFSDDLPSTTVTITKNQVRSGSPHTVSTFRPSVDLGTLAGMTQPFLDKYMDSLCGISQGSSSGGITGMANSLASNVIDAVTPPTIGTSTQKKIGPTNMQGPSQSTVSLTPEQVANMQQQGAIVFSVNKPQVPAGTQSITISQPATTTTASTQTTTTGSGSATVIPASTDPNTVVLSTSAPAGIGQYQVANQSNQINMHQGNNSQFNVPASLPGFTFSLPLAVVLDTFWAPEPNAVTKAKLKFTWDISQADLNEFNRQRAMGTLVPFASMGNISIKTEKFEFRREVGARADIGLSVQWNGSLRKLASVQFTDIAVEINDPSDKNNNVNDPLSAQTLRHSDDLLLSDVAEKIISALSGKSKSAGSAAGSTSLGDEILDEIVGEIGVKVQVVQSTLNRKVVASLKATGKDFSGKTIPLQVASSPTIFTSDNAGYPVNITFPNDCPPLKEITLQLTDVTYTFDEHGYPELVVTGFGQELPTGPLLERAELFTEASQTMTDWTSSGSDMKIVVDQKPVIYPFRGNITVGNPPGGLQGAQVRIFTRDTNGHESVFNTTDSDPAGNFIADICLFVTGNAQPTPPPYIIEVSKPGYQTITSAGNPDRFVKTKDKPLTYQINMPLSTNQVLAVSGKILDSANQGVLGAEVLLTCAGVNYQVISDASGAYQFPSILFGSKVDISVNKTGLYFPPESRNVSSGAKTITVDLKSTVDKLWGRAKFNFTAESGSLPSSINVLRSSTGRSFSLGIPANGIFELSVIGSNHETFTFSKDDYTITPGSVTAELSEGVSMEEFNITVSSRIPSNVTLSADRSRIERFGSFYNPAGENEKAVLTAKVTDSAGRGVGGVNVRFEITGVPVKILKEGTRPQGARVNAAYAQTDSTGNAQVTVCSMRDMGTVDITAAAYYGDAVSNMRSNGYALTIVENTRPERANKPTCSMTAEVGSLGLSGPGLRISTGGEILFHLNYNTNSQLGSLTGYKFLYSKDNGPAQEEVLNTSPHPVARKAFNEAGICNVQYMVKRTFDETDTWSDPAEVTFTVASYEPPRATLTLPRTAGTVNLPVDYSFVGEVSAPFKQILVTFGDNQGSVDIDAGLLNGKYYWSGTFYHTYTSEGTYQIKLKVIDQTNAFKEEIKQVTIGSVAQLNDTTAPTGSISINNGAASTTVKSVLIHATATDDISGVYRMRYSNDGINWSSWNSVAIDERPYLSIVQDRTWQLTDGAGTKTVYVQFKDAAGNISQSITDTIQLQAEGLQVSGTLSSPQVTVTGYQGAPMPHGSVAIASRSGNNISVVFSATNDWAIFVNQMALSFDNASWTGWQQFEDNKQIDVSAYPSATKLYVKYGDAAGGQSPVYSADIPEAQASPVVTQQETQTQQQTQAQETQNNVQASTQTQTASAAGSGRDRDVGLAQRNRMQKEREVSSRDIRESSGSALTRDEQNKPHDLELKKEEPQNIDISIADVILPREIIAGKPVDLEIKISNNSDSVLEDCSFSISIDDGFRERQMVSLKQRATETVRFNWIPRKDGKLWLEAGIKPHRGVEERDSRNNEIRKMIEVTAEQRDSGAPVIMERSREESMKMRSKGSGLIKEMERVEER